MKGPGILWMLQTAAGLSMAGPMFVISFEFLRTGRYVAGTGFLVLGILAVYFPTYLVNRIGGPRTWIRRWLGRRGDTSGDDNTATDGDGSDPAGDGSDGDTESRRIPLVDRLRDR